MCRPNVCRHVSQLWYHHEVISGHASLVCKSCKGASTLSIMRLKPRGTAPQLVQNSHPPDISLLLFWLVLHVCVEREPTKIEPTCSMQCNAGQITDKSDMYAFGVMVLEMMTGMQAVDARRPEGCEALPQLLQPALQAVQSMQVTALSHHHPSSETTQSRATQLPYILHVTPP